MRDLLVFWALGAVLAVFSFCGRADAAPTLVQYRAESPNYRMEYLDENAPLGPDVAGEHDVEFGQQQTQPIPAQQLPATNPPYVMVGAVVLGLALAILAYLALK